MKHSLKILTPLALVFIFSVSIVSGQVVQPETPPTSAQLRGFAGDPIRRLNLTPEQREQIRSIREQNREERAEINERLRLSNRALEELLDSDNPDEAVIEQRMKEVATAQAAAMRMRILTEVRIRRVLTLEQKSLLRTLRHQASQFRRGRPLDNFEQRRQRRDQRPLRMQNRDGIAPLAPRRDPQRKPQP